MPNELKNDLNASTNHSTTLRKPKATGSACAPGEHATDHFGKVIEIAAQLAIELAKRLPNPLFAFGFVSNSPNTPRFTIEKMVNKLVRLGISGTHSNTSVNFTET